MAILAIDAGGTRIKLGVIEDKVVVGRAWLHSDSHEGLAPKLPIIAARLQGLLSSDSSIEGVGLAFPSLIDVNGQRVIGDVGKYRDAENLDLNGWSQSSFGVPLFIENDARMAAIGEWQYGAGRGLQDMVMVTLGTGIGTGVIMNGSVLRGRHGAAGILGGHMTSAIGGRPCPCGNIGCWETEASTAALPQIAREDPGFGGSDLSKGPIDYAKVFDLSLAGDPVAIRLRTHSIDVWSALGVSLIHAYDPEMLVFGGGILASGESLLSPIRRYIQRHAWTPWREVKVEASRLGSDAALLACEWLVRDRLARSR